MISENESPVLVECFHRDELRWILFIFIYIYFLFFWNSLISCWWNKINFKWLGSYIRIWMSRNELSQSNNRFLVCFTQKQPLSRFLDYFSDCVTMGQKKGKRKKFANTPNRWLWGFKNKLQKLFPETESYADSHPKK